MEIVKVQRPLAGSGDYHSDYLVYERRRTRQSIGPVSDDVRAAMGEDPKAYFNAEWTANGWVIHDRVADQPW